MPRAFDIFKFRGSTNIIQEYIDGAVLADVWAKMGLDERTSCMDQLKGYMAQLRSLTPPEPGRVQAVDRSGCFDDKLHYPGEWGPFESHDAFNSFVAHDYIREHLERYPDSFSGHDSRPNVANDGIRSRRSWPS